MGETVLRQDRGGMATLTINRPDKLNSLNVEVFQDLNAHLAALEQQTDEIGCVVLRGEGKAFCAGLDWQAFLAAGAESRERLLSRSDASPANVAQRVGWIWQELPVPVICAVHGVAFGGGLQIALGADLRLVGPEAQLSVMEIKYGLVPDMSATQTPSRWASAPAWWPIRSPKPPRSPPRSRRSRPTRSARSSASTAPRRTSRSPGASRSRPTSSCSCSARRTSSRR